VAYANPYLMCLTCRCRVTDAEGGRNVPCGDPIGFVSACPTWSPVDSCMCDEKAHLGLIGYVPFRCEPPKHYEPKVE
jgi:hypothetical protein